MYKEFEGPVDTKKYFTGTAFITFTTILDKLNFMDYWLMSDQMLFFYHIIKYGRCIKKQCCAKHFSKYMWDGKIVKVRKAPEPSDILWENVGVSTNKKIKRKLMTWFLLAILI